MAAARRSPQFEPIQASDCEIGGERRLQNGTVERNTWSGGPSGARGLAMGKKQGAALPAAGSSAPGVTSSSASAQSGPTAAQVRPAAR